MNFKLTLFLVSLISAKALDLGDVQVAEKEGQILGLLNPSTRQQVDETADKLTETLKGLLGLDLAKLQLLPNKKNENAVLANLKPDEVREQSDVNHKGLVNDLLDVITIPDDETN
jgi:hypothetical protein